VTTLWEGLLTYAKKAKLPKINRDLWEAQQQVVELRIIVERLTEEFEAYRNVTEAEITKLRMEVEVLKAHEQRGRRNG
jgi:hypothetical protein